MKANSLTIAATLLFIIAALISPPEANSEISDNSEQGQKADEKKKRLFKKLKQAQTEQEARHIEAEIWEHWLRDTDITSRTLVMDAIAMRATPHLDHVMDLLNTAIKRTPDYAEAWNQRAFMHFLNNDYEASLSDIEEALKREPNHFGALAGKARILKNRGHIIEMRRVLERAIKINPWLKERKFLKPESEGIPL
jgi:tetratricopeptide (TPR) repeat protein